MLGNPYTEREWLRTGVNENTPTVVIQFSVDQQLFLDWFQASKPFSGNIAEFFNTKAIPAT